MTERFTLLTELGRGGMGVVWKARDEETGQIVALKLLRETYAEDPDYLARFERELELAKRIHSPNVVRVLGFGVRKKVPYLALEYVEGPSLREALASHGPYTWDETRGLLAQIAQGLADAHRAGVIHRDVKPSNVLLAPDGTAKLTDFGIARGLDLTRVTATSTLLGTPAYLPPEGPEDERSDVYSLGIIGYELLTGAPPFDGKTYQAVMLAHIRTAPDLTKLPAEARPIIGGLLAKEPGERPQTARELLWLGAESVRARSYPSIASRTTGGYLAPVAQSASVRARRRPRALWTATIVSGVAIVAIAGSAAYGRLISQPSPSRYDATSASVSHLPTLSAQADSPSQVASASLRHYVVKAGDSLVKVANFYRITVQTLLVANPQLSDSNALQVGEILTIPPTAGDSAPASAATARKGLGVTSSMTSARAGASATLLANGLILVAGGCVGTTPIRSAELYNPATGTFSVTGSMSVSRGQPTATLLFDGRVLVVGGDCGSGPLNSAELYDPATGTFSASGSMGTARREHTATLLNDGRVLVAGGESGGWGIGSAEVFDPASGTFTVTGSMKSCRGLHTATLLPSSGMVLITGGLGCSWNAPHLASSELYNPTTGTFAMTGSMATDRVVHTATLLSDGRVLVVGGTNDSGYLVSAEIYDPTTAAFSRTGSMATGRYYHAAALLPDGSVFVAGGENRSGALATCELYDPNTGVFTAASSMTAARRAPIAASLSDGSVLVSGGYDSGNNPLASAELYTP